MTLLETTSLTYRRRLVRELNATPDGFYCVAGIGENKVEAKLRCNRAKLTKGVLRVHTFAYGLGWFVPALETFDDAYGRSIVASRKA